MNIYMFKLRITDIGFYANIKPILNVEWQGL